MCAKDKRPSAGRRVRRKLTNTVESQKQLHPATSSLRIFKPQLLGRIISDAPLLEQHGGRRLHNDPALAELRTCGVRNHPASGHFVEASCLRASGRSKKSS